MWFLEQGTFIETSFFRDSSRNLQISKFANTWCSDLAFCCMSSEEQMRTFLLQSGALQTEEAELSEAVLLT